MHECASIVVTNLRVANTHAHLIYPYPGKNSSLSSVLGKKVRRPLRLNESASVVVSGTHAILGVKVSIEVRRHVKTSQARKKFIVV